MIVLDYLALMGTEKSAAKHDSDIIEKSRQLKAIAMELKIPVVAFSLLRSGINLHRDHSKSSGLSGSDLTGLEADFDLYLHNGELKILKENINGKK